MAISRGRASAILLLTGGYSRRFDGGGKLQAVIDGRTRVIDVVADNLAKLGVPVFEAGIGLTKFPWVHGTQYKSPLVGVARGYEAIASDFGTFDLSIFVVAGDMVKLDPRTVETIVNFPSTRTVIPYDGSLQVLAARWGKSSLEMARLMAETNPSFSLRSALGEDVVILDDRRWRGGASPFFDIDTYDDLRRFRSSYLGIKDASQY
ncbi:MAG: NTP transferase domain-containing protein [Actinomycetota bacterium]|nr:NTP transferase domain-containing protein [Actinomycetota bacterium]